MKKLLILLLFTSSLLAQEIGLPTGTSVADGQFLKNSGGRIVGGIPTSTGATQVNRILSGCGVTYTSGLSFDVAPCNYYIGGVQYTSILTTVTLATADASNPRIDIIIVDDTGIATKVTGTAAASPAEPSIDPTTQISLVSVLVAANASTPSNVLVENVYLENTEWTCAVSDASHVCDSTNNPYAGTKDVEATTAAKNDYVQFTKSSVIILNSFNNLTFRLRSKATWASNCSIIISAQLSSANIGVGVTVSNGTFGFNSSTTGSYQLIVVPVTQFGSIGSMDRFRFTVSGGGACSLGYYIDNIILQGGFLPPSPANSWIGPTVTAEEYVSGTSNILIPYPMNSLFSGNVILIQAVDRSGGTPTTPTGYTALFSSDGSSGTKQWIFAKDATGTETGSVSITWSGTDGHFARMYIFTNSAPVASFYEDASLYDAGGTATTNAESITTTRPNELVVAFQFGGNANDSCITQFTGESGGDWYTYFGWPIWGAVTGAGSDANMRLQVANMLTLGTISGGSCVGTGNTDRGNRSFAVFSNR